MNFSQYSCNTDKLNLIAASTSTINDVKVQLIINPSTNIPPRDELTFYCDNFKNGAVITVAIYSEKYNYSNIDTVIWKGIPISSCYSEVRSRMDRMTSKEILKIKREIYL
jgi:hypothetical protein